MSNNMARAARAYINEHLGPANGFWENAALMAAIRRGDRAEVRRMVNAGARVNNRHLNAAPNQNMVMILRPNYANSSNNNERTPPPRASQRRNSNNHFLNPNHLNQIRRNTNAFFSSRQPNNNSNGGRTPPARARRNNAARSPGAPRRVRPRVSIPIPGYNNFRFSSNNNNRPYNMFPPNYTGPIYGNNVIGLRANSPAVQAPNYSKASKYLKKWLEARPHEIRLNQVLVKLPPNASDPISLKNFNKGNEAIMVLKKDVRNGKLRSKRYFLEKNVLARLAHKPWRSILRMKASDSVFKDPINRRTVYRRNLMNVKFI